MVKMYVFLCGYKVAHLDAYGCHNKELWDFNGGIEIEYEVLLNNIIEAISKNNITRNLSILGGEPLCEENIDLSLNIAKDIKIYFPNIKIYCWTGNSYEDLIDKYGKEKFKNIDFMIDGKFILEKRDITLKLKGSSNQRIIDVQKSLKENKIILYE